MGLPDGFPITKDWASALFEELKSKKIAVVGDFHLDVYWHADMRAARLSRETPHFARPVVTEQYYPGVGGVITANLLSLGVGTVYALGACGDDWRGNVLKQRLEDQGVNLEFFRTVKDRITPTYIKPMIHGYETVQEDPRIDFQASCDLPACEEKGLAEDLVDLSRELDGIVVIDQIEDEQGGIVSTGIRIALSGIGTGSGALPVLADSRCRIGLFRDVSVKVNTLELARSLGREVPPSHGELSSGEMLIASAFDLGKKTRGDVFVSSGPEGMWYAGKSGKEHVDGVKVEGPVDTVGAGDSASAGIISALSCSASAGEAMAFANTVASITVQKIGVTGTASQGEVLELF